MKYQLIHVCYKSYAHIYVHTYIYIYVYIFINICGKRGYATTEPFLESVSVHLKMVPDMEPNSVHFPGL